MPFVGSHPSVSEKSHIRRSAAQKLGSAEIVKRTLRIALSTGPPACLAQSHPHTPPVTSTIRRVAPASASVGGKARRKSSVTLCPVTKLVPRSPCSTPASHSK